MLNNFTLVGQFDCVTLEIEEVPNRKGGTFYEVTLQGRETHDECCRLLRACSTLRQALAVAKALGCKVP
jgi:hypothetical protein